jgi:hypothetical protein
VERFTDAYCHGRAGHRCGSRSWCGRSDPEVGGVSTSITDPEEATTMNESRGAALQTALAYHQTWTSGDFELAMTYVDSDMVCEAPSGRINGAEAFREAMGPFAQILTSSRLLARSVTMRPRW